MEPTAHMEPLTVGALAVLFIGMAIKELFSWLKQRNLQNSESRLVAIEKGFADLNTVLLPSIKQTNEMYDWHNKSDQDGVKIWYIRQSLENVLRDNANAISVLAKNSELQTNLLKEMIDVQKAIMKEQTTLAHEFKLSQRNRDD